MMVMKKEQLMPIMLFHPMLTTKKQAPLKWVRRTTHAQKRWMGCPSDSSLFQLKEFIGSKRFAVPWEEFYAFNANNGIIVTTLIRNSLLSISWKNLTTVLRLYNVPESKSKGIYFVHYFSIKFVGL